MKCDVTYETFESYAEDLASKRHHRVTIHAGDDHVFESIGGDYSKELIKTETITLPIAPAEVLALYREAVIYAEVTADAD